MKKIKILSLIIIFILKLLLINSANAVECHPAYDWNWTVTNNCDWPDWKKVYGNIYVWAYTVTMGSNDDMWIDLSSKKITFTTWKINLATTAKIANHVSTRYYVWISYSTNWSWTDCDSWNWWNQCTYCPSGMYVFNRNSNSAPASNGSSNYMWSTPKTMPSNWTFYCGTKWS